MVLTNPANKNLREDCLSQDPLQVLSITLVFPLGKDTLFFLSKRSLKSSTTHLCLLFPELL